MKSTSDHINTVVSNGIDKTIFIVYPPAPKSGKIPGQRLRLSDTDIAVSGNILKKILDFLPCFSIVTPRLIIFPCQFRKNDIHSPIGSICTTFPFFSWSMLSKSLS